MNALIVRCKGCDAFLGNKFGPFFASSWSHRYFVVRGLQFIVCEKCEAEWSPLPLNQRYHKTLPELVDESRAVPLLCKTPGCLKILAQIGSTAAGGPLAIISYKRRQIVAAELLFVTCDGCHARYESPFALSPAAAPAAVTLPPYSAGGGGSSAPISARSTVH